MTADIRLAVSRIEQRRQDFHRGGFARAVRPDEAEQVARRKIELNRLDGV